MFFGRWSFAIALLCIVIGPYIIWNSIKALHSGEGMFDPENTQYMTISNWACIIIGAAMIFYGIRTAWYYFMLVF